MDSSALAKRYIAEPGSETVAARCQEAEEILLSVLCVPELISGLNRRKREKEISEPHYHELKRRLAADIDQATAIELTPPIIERAIHCMERTSLRALDAIHVASAMESACDLFITADRRQYDAATRLHIRAEEVTKLLH